MSDPPARRVARGQATVEVALALPVLAVACLLVLQLALVARAQLLVNHAAREAARAVAVDGRAGAATRAARSSPGLDRGRLRVVTSARGAPGTTVRATIRYRVRTDVALVGPLLGDPELTASVAMRVEGDDQVGP